MANYGSRILGNAISGIRAQQAVIANAGNNIANVNTPGYSRRVIQLEARGTQGVSSGINIGNGVDISQVRRIADDFLEKILREATGNQANSEVQSELLSRVEDLFVVTGEQPTIGSSLTAFFTALNDLSVNPASIELRSNVLARAQDLVTNIQTAYNTVANLQTEADQRIAQEISSVNELSARIADLNTRIASIERGGTGASASDERDTREQLLQELAGKISFSRLETGDGSVMITLSNGFPLVNGGTSRNLEVTTSPSFATGTLPPSLSGRTLSYIVYDFDSGNGTAHVDFTQSLVGTSGTIGGLLEMRGYADPTNTTSFQATGTLVGIGSRIEALTRSLLTSFNQTYLGADRDGSTAAFHEASSGDLDGNPSVAPADTNVFGFFDFNYSGTKDQGGGARDGLPTTTDLDTLVTTAGIDNFSSLLTLRLSDPRTIAAGFDTSGNASGAMQIAPGDGRNLLALAGLQTTAQSLDAGGAGSFSLTATYDDAYLELVGYVGNKQLTTKTNLSVADAQYASAQSRRDEVSGVSLDEEFTRLITAQKAFQGNARILKIADDLLTELLNSL